MAAFAVAAHARCGRHRGLSESPPPRVPRFDLPEFALSRAARAELERHAIAAWMDAGQPAAGAANHRHRPPLQRGDRAVRQRDRSFAMVSTRPSPDARPTAAPGSRPGAGSRAVHALQAGFRVDQELSGDDDLLPGLESLADFRLPPGLHADLDIDRREPAVSLGDHHHAALAGGDHRLGRHQQHFLPRRRRQQSPWRTCPEQARRPDWRVRRAPSACAWRH